MFKGVPRNSDAVVSSVSLCQFFVRPLRLLASLDLWEDEVYGVMTWASALKQLSPMKQELPYRSSQQRVKGVKPVVHVFLVEGLEEDSSMLCAHGKRVWSLKE